MITAIFLMLLALYFQQMAFFARRRHGSRPGQTSDGEAAHGMISLFLVLAAIAYAVLS